MDQTMIDLHPKVTIPYHCPKCTSTNFPYDWMIPGMRNLAMIRCENCNIEYYADLPVGHGMNYPIYLYPSSGEVYDPRNSQWYSRFLRESYAARTSQPLDFTVENFREVRNPVLLNCFDALYGHALSKLLNAQYYIDQRPDFDLILMIQPFLRWMVPKGTAEVWTIGLPLSRGREWNDWLASEIKSRIKNYSKCSLSVAFSHPHQKDFSISKFIPVEPMDLSNWKQTVAAAVITFIWRDDRLWNQNKSKKSFQQQKKNVIDLAQSIREKYPQVDFAICGFGDCGELPAEVKNLTSRVVNAEIEKQWCERYAKSHIVIGVHGSNMILPSAFAGTVIELIPEDRYGNSFQDMLFSTDDARIALVRYRLMPLASTPEAVSELACALLYYIPFIILNFEQTSNDHEAAQADPLRMARKSMELRS
jgi:hypothetical protein